MASSPEPETDESTSDQPNEFEQLRERLESLEAALERKDERIDQLERDRDRLAETVDRLEDRTDALENRAADCEAAAERLESLAEAACNKATANKERVTELQSRELEKGAHLRTDTIDEHAVTVADGRLERIEKDDGHAYYRLPEHADPLDHGDVSLAYGDLLPIQQLARMDEDRRRAAANALPTRLAAKLWQARTDSRFGDNPWEQGCKDVDEYVKAGDLRHWIRRREPGISESYAKKLVSRTIDALLDLSKNRLAVRRRTERKNGLEYTERRVILPTAAAIPGRTREDGDSRAPETADVRG
ncbi:hypothetical protein GS429_14820 [Natronorubrum sp. JWXQ-INN-674]|uniref:Uncharacterized protein n=1 Tax=Natronorubrum halalkaliphilum TaxID=2691917 RepID=A0A6B0VPU6_9EURY|nr:hypothetical protein [Natronorubrum halalkaliphilum]MXV63315.1 hypothetical protein [Natronorubrum halalkaliphilum]